MDLPSVNSHHKKEPREIDTLGEMEYPSPPDHDEPEFWNLLVIVRSMAEQLEPEKKARVIGVLEGSDLSQIELCGREGDEILFRVTDQIFHVPISALTRPTRPGAIEGN